MAILAFSSNNIFDSTSAGRALLTAADASAQRTLLGLSSSSAVSFQSLVLSGQSLTGSIAISVFDATTTWNTTGTPIAWKLNVTDTASNANSLLLDLQVGSVSMFKVAKTGRTDINGTLSTGGFNIFCGALMATSFIGVDSSGDTKFFRDAGGIFAQRNGVNAQTLRVYNTYTDASNYERAKIAWSSNVLQIGTEKLGTGIARAMTLQTDGTTRLNISATTPVIKIGNDVNGCAIFSFSGSTYSTPANGTNLGFFSYDNGLNSFGIAFGAESVAPASGSGSHVLFVRTFAPTSGTSLYHFIDIQSTVNQTGGANGITRGIYVRPTLTAAADWRSIETSNNTGYAFHGTGTAPSYFGGNVSIGTNTASARLHARGSTASSGTNAFIVENSTPSTLFYVANDGVIGIGNDTQRSVIYPYSTSGGLAGLGALALTGDLGIAISSNRAASGTVPGGVLLVTRQFASTSTSGSDVLFVVGHKPSLGFAPTSGTTTFTAALIYPIINQTGGANGITRGVYVNPTLTAAADWRSVETSNNTGWAFYGAGTANSYFGGNVGIGTTSPASLLDVTGQTNVAATIYLRNTNSAASALTTLSLVNSAGNLCSLYKKSPNAAADPHAMVFDADNTSSTLAAMIFASSGVERMRISTTGSVGIGTNNPLARLHVKGSGTTSATFGINLEDSAGTHVFRVRDDGGIHIGPTTAATNGAFISASDGTDNNGTTTGSGLRYRSSLTISSTGSDHLFRNYQGSRTGTSGTSNLMEMNGGFAPTSGTGVYNFVRVVGTINQTGGSTGITRGIWVSPTLTAAADFRAIETENGSWRLNDTYAAGSGSLAGSALTINQTFNTTGAPTALALNITDTASATTGSTAAFTISTGGTARIMFHKSPAANGSIWGTVWITNNNNGVMVNPGSVTLGSNTLLQWTTSGVTSTTYSTPELVLAKDAANILAQRNGVNAQIFRVYNTYTDASNYERAKIAWESNILRIGTENAGTGSARAFELQTNGLTQFTIAANGIITTTNGINVGSSSNSITNASANGTGTERVFACSQAYAATAGSRIIFSSTNSVQPTSGTLTYTGVGISPTINQTGGANGITRGIHINPTLTAAADWRAIEITAGKTIVAPSTTTSASLNIPSGTAPTSPVDGDIWFDGTALKIRIGGVTKTVTVT